MYMPVLFEKRKAVFCHWPDDENPRYANRRLELSSDVADIWYMPLPYGLFASDKVHPDGSTGGKEKTHGTGVLVGVGVGVAVGVGVGVLVAPGMEVSVGVGVGVGVGVLVGVAVGAGVVAVPGGLSTLISLISRNLLVMGSLLESMLHTMRTLLVYMGKVM